MSQTRQSTRLFAGAARQIDQTCDRFESVWRANKRPMLEEFLGVIDTCDRPALLHDLLLLDWDYRKHAGENPQTKDYLDRFPEYASVIEAVGDEMTAARESTLEGTGRVDAVQTPWIGGEPGRNDDKPAGTQSKSQRYDLIQEVGHGGIGIVFRAHDRLLGRVGCQGVARNLSR